MKRQSLLAAALLVASSGAASAATLFYDGFETYALGTPSNISATWTLLEGNVDVIGSDYNWYPGKQLDMNGSGGETTAASIMTVISGFVVGQYYTLSFDYGANKNSNFGTTGAEQLLYQVMDGTTALLSSFVTTSGGVPNLLNSGNLTFQATNTSLSLYFADGLAGLPYNDDNDQGGPILDNVMVSTVPLPAGGLLLLGGLAAFGALRRRRRT